MTPGQYDHRPLGPCKDKLMIDVTPSEVYRIIKRRPNTFCETKRRDVFDDIYHETSGGTVRRESVIKLTKGQLAKIIRESVLNKLFL